MAAFADFTEEQMPDKGSIIRFSGTLVIASADAVDGRLRALTGPVQRIDISDVDHIDTLSTNDRLHSSPSDEPQCHSIHGSAICC